MILRQLFSLSTVAFAAGLCSCGGGGNASLASPGMGAQTAGYVPQSAIAGAAQTGDALAKPLPDALIALGKPAASPNLTAPIINDSGSYTNGPIILGTNTTNGYGVEGVTGGTGAGLYGHSSYTGTGTSYGVYGYSANGSGVYGYSATYGRGVLGVSVNGEGVEGETSFPSNGSFTFQRAGVLGEDLSTDSGENDAGVAGTSSGGYGVYGQSANGAGVYGLATNFAGGVVGIVNASDNYGEAVVGNNFGSGNSGLGGDGSGVSAFSAKETALIGEAESTSSTTPVEILYSDSGQPFIIGENYTGNPAVAEFSLDANGNMILRGNLTVDGTVFSKGTAHCTSCTGPLLAHRVPQAEDVGEGQLSGGRGYVKLDPDFAAQLDPAQRYHVFLTPEGDSKGLFVTNKSAAGFTVRENQNGTSTLSFDYRIVGPAKAAGGLPSPLRTYETRPHPSLRRYATRP